MIVPSPRVTGSRRRATPEYQSADKPRRSNVDFTAAMALCPRSAAAFQTCSSCTAVSCVGAMVAPPNRLPCRLTVSVDIRAFGDVCEYWIEFGRACIVVGDEARATERRELRDRRGHI